MNLKFKLIFFMCLMFFSMRSEAQTRLGLAVGIEHFVCTQARWGRLSLNWIETRRIEIGIIDKRKDLIVGMIGNFIDGSVSEGNTYLWVFNISKIDSVVYDSEFISVYNKSEYADYKRDLFKKSPKFMVRIGPKGCSKLNSHRKIFLENVRKVIRSSLEDYLLVYSLPYHHILLCNFSKDDPYAVAMVYWKTTVPTIYSITLYQSEKPRRLSKLSRGDFAIGLAGDISPSLASESCE